jgi:hypothetical protein
MRVYTVHEGRAGDPDDTVFVKDGFCWPALFVPALWLIYRRLWFGLVVWLGVGLTLAMLLEVGGVSDGAAVAVMLGFHVLVAFEANDWLRRTLARNGRPQTASVAAPDLASAEIRYFQLGSAVATAASPPFPGGGRQPAPLSRTLTDSPALGLFPQPERRR